MKVTVCAKYRDMYTGELHFPGEVLSVTPERAAQLSSKNVIAPNMVAEDVDFDEKPEKAEEPKEVKAAEEKPEKVAKKPAKKTTTRKR